MSFYSKLGTDKIINFTPTGTQTTRENSFAPLTPNEIIEEVHNAYEFYEKKCAIWNQPISYYNKLNPKQIYGTKKEKHLK